MTNFDDLLKKYRQQVLKALKHLQYSHDRVQKLSTDMDQLSEAQLSDWESLAARFSRASDLFLSKYVRTSVLKGDPAFRGSLRDFLDQAEKQGLVESALEWMEIRETRNVSAHEYSEEKLADHFEKVRKLAPKLLALEIKI